MLHSADKQEVAPPGCLSAEDGAVVPAIGASMIPPIPHRAQEVLLALACREEKEEGGPITRNVRTGPWPRGPLPGPTPSIFSSSAARARLAIVRNSCSVERWARVHLAVLAAANLLRACDSVAGDTSIDFPVPSGTATPAHAANTKATVSRSTTGCVTASATDR